MFESYHYTFQCIPNQITSHYIIQASHKSQTLGVFLAIQRQKNNEPYVETEPFRKAEALQRIRVAAEEKEVLSQQFLIISLPICSIIS